MLLASLILFATAEDDAFDRAAAALGAGARADEAGDRARLAKAGLALRASGASPVAGEDMAVVWLRGARPRQPTMRERILGPGYRTLQLDGRGVATFQQSFLAGQRARVAVVGLNRADAVLAVREDGRALCRAQLPRARCDWVPSYTMRVTIEVSNSGVRPGRYVVLVE